jgi:acetyl esterase/lipase
MLRPAVSAPVTFLIAAFACLALTANGYRPVRDRRELLIPSFILAWIVSELPLHVLVLYAVATTAFVYGGAVQGATGWSGVAVMAAAAAGLFGFVGPARASRELLDKALREGLGEGYQSGLQPDSAAPKWLFTALPFLRVFPGVRQHLNLRYADGAGRFHLLDVYAPVDKRERAAVVLQIHGGGWFTGHKRQQALPMLLQLAARGFVCVSINYRLSPRATWPDHLLDAKLALAWIRRNIAEYGGDPDYVLVTGGSAGGHLAAMVALTANDPRYQPGFEAVDTSVRGCVPFYGVYDFTDRHKHQRNQTLQRLVAAWVLKKRLADAHDAFLDASPMTHISDKAPPFFVIQGTADTIVSLEEARAFARMMREQSREPVVYAELPGAHHAFEILHSTRTQHVVWAVMRFLEWVCARDRSKLGAIVDDRRPAATSAAPASDPESPSLVGS